MIGIESKNLSDSARDVGIAFGSSFEKAILKGEGFGNVLQGLEKELQRVLFHNLVTNPLNKFVQEILNKGLNAMLGGGEGNSGGNTFVKAMESVTSLFGDSKAPQISDKSPSAGKARLDNLSLGSSEDGNPNDRLASGGSTIIHMNINTPDAQSFRANQGEILADMNRAMQRGQRNM
jgi:hypothetical protein